MFPTANVLGINPDRDPVLGGASLARRFPQRPGFAATKFLPLLAEPHGFFARHDPVDPTMQSTKGGFVSRVRRLDGQASFFDASNDTAWKILRQSAVRDHRL